MKLDLSERAKNVLLGLIGTPITPERAAAISYAELRNSYNCGQVTIAEIDRWLISHNQPPISLPKATTSRLTAEQLRRLVDVVWQTATESQAVPSTAWADRMIAQALGGEAAGSRPAETPAAKPPR